jgi:hypothetical protein
MIPVRAQLWDAVANAPAAFAAVRVDIAGRTLTGIADANGQVMVLIPYPTFEQLRLGSPPGTGQPPITDTHWPITIRVGYPPAGTPPLAMMDLPSPWPSVPSLKPILTAPDVPVWSDDIGAPALTCTRDLRYGEPLSVHTDGSPALLTRLWIRGTSIP